MSFVIKPYRRTLCRYDSSDPMYFTCSLTQYLHLLCNRFCRDLTFPGWRLPFRFPFDIYSLGVLGKVHCINPLLFCAGYKGKMGFLRGYLLKNLPAMQGMRVWFLGWEYNLEKESATHFSILTWEIPWTEEPRGLQSLGSQKSQTWLSDKKQPKRENMRVTKPQTIILKLHKHLFHRMCNKHKYIYLNKNFSSWRSDCLGAHGTPFVRYRRLPVLKVEWSSTENSYAGLSLQCMSHSRKCWGSGPSAHRALRRTSERCLLSIMVLFYQRLTTVTGFPGGSDSKASACSAGDLGSIPGLGRSPGEGNGNPLRYSCLENSMDWGAWLAIVHGITKSQTRLSNFTATTTVITG